LLPNAREELDALKPFLLRQVHLTREGVQVFDQARHERLQTGVRRRAGEAPHDFVRNVLFIQVAHGCVPLQCGVPYVLYITEAMRRLGPVPWSRAASVPGPSLPVQTGSRSFWASGQSAPGQSPGRPGAAAPGPYGLRQKPRAVRG